MAEPNIILLGSGGHASVALGLMQSLGMQPTAIADPGRERGPTDFYGLSNIGDDDALFARDPNSIILVNGIGSVSRPRVHSAVFEKYRDRGYHFLTLVHPAAIIADNVEIGQGSLIMPGCIIQPHVRIGENVILNTRAGIDHHSTIGNGTHIAPGATICGTVRVGAGCMIGAGATIIQNINIGDSVLIGAGVTVKRDVANNGFELG